MAVLRSKEIRQLSEKERSEKFEELEKELMKLKSQSATGTAPANPGKIKAIKRTIARMLTLQRVEELGKKQ